MTDTTQQEREAAPANNLPNWSECALRVANSEHFKKSIAEGGHGPDADAKLATELHRFIHEYDDADSYRSAWFLHRLELLIKEVRATPQGAEPVAEGFMLPDGSICSTSATLGTLRVRDDDAARGCKIVSLYTHPPEPKLSELQADAKDAARYRLVRQKSEQMYFARRDPDMGYAFGQLHDEDLDSFLDAELARQEGSAT